MRAIVLTLSKYNIEYVPLELALLFVRLARLLVLKALQIRALVSLAPVPLGWNVLHKQSGQPAEPVLF